MNRFHSLPFSCAMLSPFILLHILLLTNLIFSVQSNCEDNNGNYTRNSTYAYNLNTVLSSLPANIDINGFYSASLGQSPDRANAIALCRGDILPNMCRGCVRNITTNLLTSCPNQRQAVGWNEFCMLRYSNEMIDRTTTMRPRTYLWNTQNAMNPDVFMSDLKSHIGSLRDQAANGAPLRKVAAANVTANDFQFIYALVQCTPDLSAEECTACLIVAAGDIRRCCNKRRGGRVLMPSCNLRYESYPFYNATRLQELQSVPPVPAPEPPVAPQPPLVSPPDSAGTNSGNNTARIVIIIVVVIVAVILAVSICIVRKRMKRNPQEKRESISEIDTAESLKYDLSTIRAATNDFSDDNKLGQGGFGAVYKGKLSNGQEIAVKRLSQNSRQGDVEFKNEVLLVVKLQHRNLVRLLGFCLEGMEKLLVYEFVQNASLDQFLCDPVKSSKLDWDRRYKIIGGIAKGVLYLHEDSRLRIIHRDLKASNVLLDGEMNPKIADFGMARLFGQDETQGSTNRIVGTYGYMSPEYAMHGQFSVKSDVFSFGVLVLEIMSGQKNSFIRKGDNVEDLLSFMWKHWREDTAANAIDPVLRAGKGPLRDMLRCIHIGLLCVQENPAHRPAMASVVQMLNSSSIALPVASEPAFFMYVSTESNSGRAMLKLKTVVSEGSSQNDMSVTDLYPR